MAVNGCMGLAQDERHLRRVYERRPVEGVEQLSVGQGHSSSVAKERYSGQQAFVSGSR